MVYTASLFAVGTEKPGVTDDDIWPFKVFPHCMGPWNRLAALASVHPSRSCERKRSHELLVRMRAVLVLCHLYSSPSPSLPSPSLPPQLLSFPPLPHPLCNNCAQQWETINHHPSKHAGGINSTAALSNHLFLSATVSPNLSGRLIRPVIY